MRFQHFLQENSALSFFAENALTGWGALSVEEEKLDRCSKVIIGFPVSLPSALVKR